MPRRVRALVLVFWPGLVQIWSGQEILGLILAALFAFSLNLSIASRWIWREVFPPGWSEFFGTFAVLAWIASSCYTIWWVGFCHPDRHAREIDKLFREAQEAYLRGRWSEAKTKLEQILVRDDSDADALLQLGSLYLRTERPALARRAFLQCLESRLGVKWRWEIERALSRLEISEVPPRRASVGTIVGSE
jgi:tetratricopeptide (TPR) repeat protein